MSKTLKIVLFWEEWTLSEVKAFVSHCGKHPREFLDFSDSDGGKAKFENLMYEPDAAAAFIWVGVHRDEPEKTIPQVEDEYSIAQLAEAIEEAAKAMGLQAAEEEAPAVVKPRPPRKRSGSAK